MGKATGVFLILAGLGTAALVLPAVDRDAERQLSDVIRIATGATAQLPANAKIPSEAAPVAAQRVASVQQAVTSVQQATTGSLAPVQGSPPHSLTKLPVAPQNPATSMGETPPSLVAPPQLITRNATASPARPAGTEARANLSRDIQRELKRVGCYDGEISGEWTTGTRRAMKTFVDRVNAALPTDEPDHILRTMVQGHPGNACGKACPAGQTAANDGRCLPAAIVAQHTLPKPAARDTIAVPKDVTVASAPQALRATADVKLSEARTSDAKIAEVKGADAKAARSAVPKATWETTVAAAPTVPLPGAETRMSIGGPASAPAFPPAAVGVGPRTPQAPDSSASAGQSPKMPGAIAALATPKAATSPRSPEARSSPAVEPHRPASKPQREASVPRQTASEPEPPRPSQPLAKPERERERPRQQAAVVRRPPPELFKYPAPSFVGINVPKFLSNFQKPERSTFGPRFYERSMRDLR
jgi:hypothetical protein